MGNTCGAATACCTNNTPDENLENSLQRTTINFSNLQEIYVPDEQELRKLESMLYAKCEPEMLTTEICSKSTIPEIFSLLKKNEKT